MADQSQHQAVKTYCNGCTKCAQLSQSEQDRLGCFLKSKTVSAARLQYENWRSNLIRTAGDRLKRLLDPLILPTADEFPQLTCGMQLICFAASELSIFWKTFLKLRTSHHFECHCHPICRPKLQGENSCHILSISVVTGFRSSLACLVAGGQRRITFAASLRKGNAPSWALHCWSFFGCLELLAKKILWLVRKILFMFLPSKYSKQDSNMVNRTLMSCMSSRRCDPYPQHNPLFVIWGRVDAYWWARLIQSTNNPRRCTGFLKPDSNHWSLKRTLRVRVANGQELKTRRNHFSHKPYANLQRFQTVSRPHLYHFKYTISISLNSVRVQLHVDATQSPARAVSDYWSRC